MSVQMTMDSYGPGRYRCSECKEVGFYTEQWKDFYLNGIPFAGSQGVVLNEEDRQVQEAGIRKLEQERMEAHGCMRCRGVLGPFVHGLGVGDEAHGFEVQLWGCHACEIGAIFQPDTEGGLEEARSKYLAVK